MSVGVPAPAPSAGVPADATPATVPAPASAATPPTSEAQLIEQLYAVNAEGRLVMSRTPKAPADVLLLVLYGMVKVQESPSVSAPMLVKTARAAGAQFERGDRLLAKRPTLIQGRGQARGKQYRLTPQGEKHCRSLIRSLVASGDGKTPQP